MITDSHSPFCRPPAPTCHKEASGIQSSKDLTLALYLSDPYPLALQG